MNILSQFLPEDAKEWNSLILVKLKYIIEDDDVNISVKTNRLLQWTKKHKHYPSSEFWVFSSAKGIC